MTTFENWPCYSIMAIFIATPKQVDFINPSVRSSKRFKLIVEKQRAKFLISIAAVYSGKTI